MTPKITSYTRGATAARSDIERLGEPAARALADAALPPGEPCQLAIDEWRYWTAFRGEVNAASAPRTGPGPWRPKT